MDYFLFDFPSVQFHYTMSPKLKGFTFESAIIQRYQRRKCSVEETLVEMYFVEADIIIKREKSVCR